MTKIVFSDIDGTLLVDDRHISPETAEAVRRLAAKGIPFVPVSAHMPEAIYPLVEVLGVRCPIISYSGAYVLDEEKQELFSRPMKSEDIATALVALAEEARPLTVNWYEGRHWYVESADDPYVQKESSITGAHAEVQDFQNLLADGHTAHKILLMGEPAAIETADKALAARLPHLHVVRSASWLLEIMDKAVSKSLGLEKMLAYYHLTPADALAFGDNYNDLEMFALARESVAMGNAPEDVKRAAKHVTAPNTENGIVKYLEKAELL